MKKYHAFVIHGVAAAIFLFGLASGFSVAVRKPLWNDEIYSQVANVDGLSMSAIWRGGVQEGNNSPLFYALQKSVCSVLHYTAGDLWHQQPFEARIILRILPVMFMSLGLALSFWAFARSYSITTGVVAFLTALGTYLVWGYIAEARPYAMVFFGSVLQAVVLLRALRSGDLARGWVFVAMAHMFLAVTSSLSVIQITSAGAVLWVAGHRRIWPLLAMVILPLAVGFGYHQLYRVTYHFYFASYGQPLDLVKAAVPEGRLQFLLIVPFFLWVWARRSGEKVCANVWLFLGWAWLTILGYGVFLGYLWVNQKFPTPSPAFEVSNRYMMALAGVSCAAIAVLCEELVRRPRVLWLRVLMWGGILALILPRLVKVFRWAATLT